MNTDELLAATVTAERGLVGMVLAGATMQEESWVGEVLATGLRAPDFSFPDYRRAWRAIQFTHDGGNMPTVYQTSCNLAVAKDFYEGWDEVELAELMPYHPTLTDVKSLARAVHQYAQERRERTQIMSNTQQELDAVGEKPHWRAAYEQEA